MIKAPLFPKIGPPPIQCCFKGDTLSALTQHCMRGRGEGTVKLSKKAKCTITFDQDCLSEYDFRDRSDSLNIMEEPHVSFRF